MDGWAAALASTPLSRQLREAAWLYPLLEIAHILGFVLLVGSIAMFDLRLLGAARNLSVSALGAHLRKWSLGSVAVVAPSGALLFTANPQELAGNPVFALKLGAIALAALNAAAYQLGAHRTVSGWDTGAPSPLRARLHALASLTLWPTTIACGRLLAYT